MLDNMIDKQALWALVAAGLIAGFGCTATAKGRAVQQVWHFEQTAVGAIPSGWHSEATHGKGHGPLWQVVTDPTAPSPDHALKMAWPGGESRLTGFLGNLFNLCWTSDPAFADGEIRVRFKAISGREDQGGGILWRLRDKNNYYVARFNPLEDNFRLYFVRAGHRKTLASPHFSQGHDCDRPMRRADWRSLGRAARRSVDYACAALGRERQSSHHLERPRYATL